MASTVELSVISFTGGRGTREGQKAEAVILITRSVQSQVKILTKLAPGESASHLFVEILDENFPPDASSIYQLPLLDFTARPWLIAHVCSS